MGDLAAVSNTNPFNAEEALQYKAQAIQELTAAGATFPIKVLMPYNPGTTYWGRELPDPGAAVGGPAGHRLH